MTPQDALDKAWDWFVIQKKPLGQHAGLPVFIGPDGCRCVIAILLPPDIIIPEHHQAITAVMLRRERESVDRALRGLDDGFLGALQAAHDSCVLRGKRIYDTLRALAKSYELQIPTT